MPNGRALSRPCLRHTFAGNKADRREPSQRRYAADKAECLAHRFARGSHPSEGMPQTRPNAWQRISAGGHPLFRIGARARGRSPKTLSLGWLPAIRFIPAARVLGDLPPTVDLRRIMGTLSVRSDLTFHRLGSKRDQFLERFTVSN
jgi:hypothetical protein